ncbi:unnamed protein product [Medioppia subpectinata]|uniref:Uncharacterized protein n=1 Tax=Medioppia subpectinata TaxID=1979941 RepID=A0A7R9PW21_9ACAR|nr:unnamed protein product [Medioppia subpectinata]CAG2102419.1 unnamed protein product [Medioppia subpectinata]
MVSYALSTTGAQENKYEELYELDYLLTYNYLRPGRMFPETVLSLHNVWCKNYVGKSVRIIDLVDKVFGHNPIVQLATRMLSLSKIKTMHGLCGNPEAMQLVAVVMKIVNTKFEELYNVYLLALNTYLAAALPESDVGTSELFCYLRKFVMIMVESFPPELAEAVQKENEKSVHKMRSIIRMVLKLLKINPRVRHCPFPHFRAPNPLKIKSEMLALMFAFDRITRSD